MKKGIVLPFLLLLTSVAFILGAFFVLNSKPKPTGQIVSVSPTPTPDPTANWKTYRNEKYGFEIKYPSDWFADEFYNVASEEVIPFLLSIGRKRPAEEELVLGLRWYELNLIQREEFSDFEFEKIKKACGSGGEGNQNCPAFNVEEVRLGQVEVLREFPILDNQDDGRITRIYLNYGGFGWTWTFQNRDFQGSHDPIYDQILSTFKFLD